MCCSRTATASWRATRKLLLSTCFEPVKLVEVVEEDSLQENYALFDNSFIVIFVKLLTKLEINYHTLLNDTNVVNRRRMSFDLNKLVQPECGGANPLVATARQIAMRPVASSSVVAGPSTRISNNRLTGRQRQDTANFSKEFLGQQFQQLKLTSQISATGQQQQQQVPVITSSAALTTVSQTPYSMASTSVVQPQAHFSQQAGGNLAFQQRPSQAQMSSMFETQLETKYRNDILSSIAQSTASETTADIIEPVEIQAEQEAKSETTSKDHERADDVEFWQSLAQSYVGPPTFVAPTETEYIFDERNPLKDQFEDPFAEGLKKLEQGDIPSAALLFEAAVLKDPENSAAWRLLGTTQAQNEKDVSAIRALKNCLKIDANDQEARLALSVSLANENYKNEACDYLMEWLINHDKYKSISGSFEGYKQLGQGFDAMYAQKEAPQGEKNSYEYVRDKFVDAARMSPNNPDYEVQSSLGVLFNMQGEYEKAVDCFKAALSVRSDDSLLWNRLGATLANGNKSDEAVIAYRKALDISPGFLRSRYNLAISLIHLNTYDEAAKQLVQILNMQAAGKGAKNVQIRTRSITSSAIWNTLRTVATLLNKPELYAMIDGRDLPQCNGVFLQKNRPTAAAAETDKTN